MGSAIKVVHPSTNTTHSTPLPDPRPTGNVLSNVSGDKGQDRAGGTWDYEGGICEVLKGRCSQQPNPAMARLVVALNGCVLRLRDAGWKTKRMVGG